MSFDSQLQRSVLAELNWDPSITAGHIGVTADKGVVTLSGHVATYAEKHAAEVAARRVKGVKAVAEEIEVRLPDHGRKSDEEIAAAIIDRLAWDVCIPREKVGVTVEKGFVTLTGEVDWHFQRDCVAEDIRRVEGIVGVSNQIRIAKKVDTSELADDITHALHRSWFFDPETVRVTADEGVVTLNGTVRTPHERQVAAATAWAAAGVTDVHNELAVA